MTNKIRTHITNDNLTPGPAHIMKEDFGKRLYRLIVSKGWTQSELARRADLPRDSISVYIRGKSLPTPRSLEKLAAALDVSANELMPNHVESAIDNNTPLVDVRVSPNAPSMALFRANALLPVEVALEIQKMIFNAYKASSGN